MCGRVCINKTRKQHTENTNSDTYSWNDFLYTFLGFFDKGYGYNKTKKISNLQRYALECARSPSEQSEPGSSEVGGGQGVSARPLELDSS